MEIKFKSHFKNPAEDTQWFNKWVSELEKVNNKRYERIEVQASLGKTHVWGLNTSKTNVETIIIFPGARTSVLFWDFDNNLATLEKDFRIFLVETNGLPNLSDGNTPDIKSSGYGEWASELMNALKIEKAFVAGASFGGLICMKLCLTAPEKVKAAFLLNPGCLQPFSLSLKNLYYNILPILAPSRKNVLKFLDKAVFCKPFHKLSEASEKLIVDYEVFALTRYKDNTQKPYDMNNELRGIKTDTYLIEGDADLLFPFQKSIDAAKEKITSLKEVMVLPHVGHGVETDSNAIKFIGDTIKKYA